MNFLKRTTLNFKTFIVLIITTIFLTFMYTFDIASLSNSFSKQRNYSRFFYKINMHPKTENIELSKEFQSARIFWRPEKVNPVIPYNFNESFDNRILLQREWMKNITKADIFKQFKQKRILVERDYPYYYPFGMKNCGKASKYWKQKCVFEKENNVTNDTTFPDNIKDFDAVISFRKWLYKNKRKLPEGSSVKQILTIIEPAYKTGYVDLNLNNAFLASYFRGSDIPIPMLKWVPHQQDNNLKIPKSSNASKNYAEGKTKLAAILVSNCKPNNNRLEYVKELQRYIPVDIYGKCGKLKCRAPCYENLKKQYKFYLAFENANCRDYMTEKLYRNALMNGMVPVVLGAHKKDYLSAAPPNSFIHVEDFESPKELATFLKKIDGDNDLYNAYFEWKSKGKLLVELYNDFFCRACALLFVADFINQPIWSQGSTWENVNVCLPTGRWYWNRPN